MSAAAATADAGAGPAKKGKKKLVIIIVAVLVLLLGGGGAAMVLMKKKAAAAVEEGEEDAAPHAAAHKSAKIDPKHPPTFVPLDPFVVNLADKEADRYAQIGITLEVEDPHFADEMKAFMPAIRNGILMILAHKSSKDLQDRSGKEALAGQIQREAARTMGIEIDEPDPEDDAEAEAPKAKVAEDDAPKPKAKKKKKKKKAASEENPIQHVLFSNFIIQ